MRRRPMNALLIEASPFFNQQKEMSAQLCVYIISVCLLVIAFSRRRTTFITLVHYRMNN